MRHKKNTVKLGRTASHRKALMRNQLTDFFDNGYIITTLAKARALRPTAEKLITRAKIDSVANRRYLARYLFRKGAIIKLFSEIAPNYKERPGGYTRIIKLQPRSGDNAPQAKIELV